MFPDLDKDYRQYTSHFEAVFVCVAMNNYHAE